MPPIKVNPASPPTGVSGLAVETRLVAPSEEPLPTNAARHLHRLVEGRREVKGGEFFAAPDLAALFIELFGDSGGGVHKTSDSGSRTIDRLNG